MSMLDTEIQALFGGVFGGVYIDGTILAPVTYTDDGGGGLTEVPGPASPCKLQVDAVTEMQRLEEGYQSSDVRILILQYGQSAAPKPSCRVTARGVTYHVGPVVTQDPARSYWQMRGIPA